MDKKLSELVDIRQMDGIERQDYPKKVENLLVNKMGWFKKWIIRPLVYAITFGGYKVKGKKVINPELVQPFLFLIRDDGYLDVIEGVKPGLFVIKSKDSNNREKGILLGSDKLRTLNIVPYPRCWIAYENEMTPYPLSVYHDSEEFFGIIRKLQTAKNLLKDDEKLMTAKMWFWLAIIGGIGLLLYFGFSQGWFEKLGEMMGGAK